MDSCFIYSLDKHIQTIYYVLGTVLRAWKILTLKQPHIVYYFYHHSLLILTEFNC